MIFHFNDFNKYQLLTTNYYQKFRTACIMCNVLHGLTSPPLNHYIKPTTSYDTSATPEPHRHHIFSSLSSSSSSFFKVMGNLYYGLLRNHHAHLCNDHRQNAVVIMGSCVIIMGNGQFISHIHLYNISLVSHVVLYNIYIYIF